MTPKLRDWLYIVFFTIVLTSLIHRIEKRIEPAVVSQVKVITAATKPAPVKAIVKYVEKEDPRVKKVSAFLSSRNSPLAPFAKALVQASDDYGLDYTLMIAISGKESGYGVHGANFNAWGIMAWDSEGKRHLRRFSSWEEGIEYEARLLSETYRPHMIQGIQTIYCPSYECSITWVKDVVTFSNELLKQ